MSTHRESRTISSDESNAKRCHSELEYRELLNQVQLLQTKLHNKVEALLAVSRDLAACQKERDAFANECEALRDRVKDTEVTLDVRQESNAQEYDRAVRARDLQQSELKNQLTKYAEQLSYEQRQTDALRQELREAHGDIKVLRQRLATRQISQLSNHEVPAVSELDAGSLSTPTSKITRTPSTDTSTSFKISDGGSLENFERLMQRYRQLESDLRSVLCEKEELINEKETFKKKCERLSNELLLIINNDSNKIVADVDGIIAENRFLKAQIEHAKEETGMARQTLNRYRNLVERRKKRADGPGAALKAANGEQQHCSSTLMGVTVKQVRELLGSAMSSEPSSARGSTSTDEAGAATPSTEEADTDYVALCTVLYEAVVDKNMVLAHQKKANKILGARLNELETKLRSMEEQSRSPNILTPLAGDMDTLRAKLENIAHEDNESSAFETEKSRYTSDISRTKAPITQERDVQTDEDSNVSYCAPHLIERSMCTDKTQFIDATTDALIDETIENACQATTSNTDSSTQTLYSMHSLRDAIVQTIDAADESDDDFCSAMGDDSVDDVESSSGDGDLTPRSGRSTPGALE